MPNISLDIKYVRDPQLLITPAELRDKYLFGIRITDDNGNSIPDSTLEFYIKAAQEDIEDYLNIKLKKQVIDETKSFNKVEWEKWGYVKTTYPVVCPHEMQGFFNKTKQIDYPKVWLSSKKTNDGKFYHRRVNIVPAGEGTTHQQSAIFTGLIPQLGFHNMRNIPDYWRVVYTTGFDVVPSNLIEVTAKLSTLGVFNVAGDIVIGAGIASQSIGIDGLSQSIQTTSSAENSAYSARIKQYLEELKQQLPRLRDQYRGFSFMAV